MKEWLIGIGAVVFVALVVRSLCKRDRLDTEDIMEMDWRDILRRYPPEDDDDY